MDLAMNIKNMLGKIFGYLFVSKTPEEYYSRRVLRHKHFKKMDEKKKKEKEQSRQGSPSPYPGE